MIKDICANRHGGDRASQIAYGRGNKEQDRLVVLHFLRGQGDKGATLDETCVALGRHPNQLSGRFTELKVRGLIVPNGIRRTRTNSPAKVWDGSGPIPVDLNCFCEFPVGEN